MIADLDRPPITEPFPPWNRDVTLRAISAADLAELNDRFETADLADNTKLIAFYAALLAKSVTDPAAPEDEWRDVSQATLLTLGNRCLALAGIHADTTKKNSPDP